MALQVACQGLNLRDSGLDRRRLGGGHVVLCPPAPPLLLSPTSGQAPLRSFVQYDSLITDPALTSLESTKNLNVDLLATYLVNPWTALYVGYNNNQNNLRLTPIEDDFELVRRDRLGPDSWQFFVKASYPVRF